MTASSVFPDSRVEKSSFETQNWPSKTDFKSEPTSKYILDIPWVFPAHFPDKKHLSSRKIGQNQLKSRKVGNNRIKSFSSIPFGGPIGVHRFKFALARPMASLAEGRIDVPVARWSTHIHFGCGCLCCYDNDSRKDPQTLILLRFLSNCLNVHVFRADFPLK